jgi:hypothetical protein
MTTRLVARAPVQYMDPIALSRTDPTNPPFFVVELNLVCQIMRPSFSRDWD